jgi:hypothetical protein
MRQFVTSVLVIGTVTSIALAAQASSAGKTRISACSLLPADLVVKVGGITPQMAKALPPREEASGPNGSECNFGQIRLLVDPVIGSGASRQPPGKGWQPLSGVGDTAFYRANGGTFAEIVAWTAAHHFFLSFTVPTGSSVDATKPKAIELSQAITPKLR